MLIAICAALVAACGSSGGSGSGSGSGGSSAGPATVTTTQVSGYGKVLATGKGTPLYVFTGDPSGGSKCVGACAKQWEPLTASGKPTAGTGANAGMLSTFKRGDGRVQVLYNGHALYTHASGASAGSVAGTASDGGIWYLVSPAGKPITSTNSGGY